MENKPASLLAVSLGKALSEISHHGVVDRWLATPEQARIAHCSLSRKGKINMQLSTKNTIMFDKNDASKFFGSRRFRTIFFWVVPKSICGPLNYTTIA